MENVWQTSFDLHKRMVLYRDGLLKDTLPFWIDHCVDRECGGFLFALGRDGNVIDTDKPVWTHGRFVWLLSTLYNQVEPREEWLELARHGLRFLRRHAFDTDGRMFFHLTREGKPVRKRRYLFSEMFTIIALASYARATGDEAAAAQAHDLFDLALHYQVTPGLLPPKTITETRESKGLGMSMILIATAQVLREMKDEPAYTECIDHCIDDIRQNFMHEEFQAVLEVVGPNGEFQDSFDGRQITPGHAIEAAWFILHESKVRGGDPDLLKTGLTILDWSWKQGWDEEYGGLLYFRDVKGLPVQEYWHDMKFWWPHNEAIIATLLAWSLTGDAKYWKWYEMVHDWAYCHFPDPDHGEWFGYLHRDGRLSVSLKGNMWKGPFHLPRMQLYCWKLLEEMIEKKESGE